MAKKNETEAAQSTYSETMIARVNEEGNHHEVILRGFESVNTLVLRNQRGTKGFKDGSRYTVTFTEIPEAEYAPVPTAEEVAAARATIDASEAANGVSDEGQATDPA